MPFTIPEEIKKHSPNHYFTIIIHKSNQMLVFDEKGKPEYPGKNLSWQSRVQTNSTTYDTKYGNRTRATLEEGKCSHH